MNATQKSISKGLSVLVAMLLSITPVWPQSAPPEGSSVLHGTIRDTEKRPIVGVTVLAYQLSTGQTHRSAPTNKKGEFRIENLTLGYYDVAVETPAGLFVGNAVVNLRPSGKAILDIVVAPFGPETEGADRVFRGTESKGDGVARVDEKLTSHDFWRSPKGIAILAGSGGALLLLFATSDSSNEVPISPFRPQ